MDIIVQGIGEKNFKPNVIKLSFEFRTKESNYEKALEEGIKSVEKYFNLLTSMGFDTKEVKTKSFRVYENTKYNESTRKYDPDGYMFNQSAVLSFDYDIKKMSVLMEETSKQECPPTYRISFEVKDDKAVEEEIIALAYKEAEFQANAIAKASGKTVKGCVKVSFDPFDGNYVSNTRYDMSERCFAKASCASEAIQTVFVPEDVTVSKELYCQFVAE